MMQDVLSTAIEMHRAGQLATAVQLYQAVLAVEQENADALHLLGVLNHQQGNHARAVELIGLAVAVRPNAHIFHANLAEAYRAQGQFDRAVGCCRAALRLWPDYPEALCNLGRAARVGPALAKRPATSAALWSCGRTLQWPITIWASRCASWAIGRGIF